MKVSLNLAWAWAESGVPCKSCKQVFLLGEEVIQVNSGDDQVNIFELFHWTCFKDRYPGVTIDKDTRPEDAAQVEAYAAKEGFILAVGGIQ